MKSQRSLVDILDDCINRLAAGQSLEACLALYPDYAPRLRVLLENVVSLRALRVPQTELLEDQALVWKQIVQTLPAARPARRGGYRGLLLAAILLLLLLSMIGATWFVLTRPDLPNEDRPLIVPLTEPATPTLSVTPSATLSATPTTTPTMTATPSPTYTVTPSATATTTPTATRTPGPTATRAAPTATTASGCGVPLTMQDAANRVRALYPNATVTSISPQVLSNGLSVWVVTTNQQLRVTIDAACGGVLNIEQISSSGGSSGGSTNQNVNDNNSDDSGKDANNNSDDRDSNDNGDRDDDGDDDDDD